MSLLLDEADNEQAGPSWAEMTRKAGNRPRPRAIRPTETQRVKGTPYHTGLRKEYKDSVEREREVFFSKFREEATN